VVVEDFWDKKNRKAYLVKLRPNEAARGEIERLIETYLRDLRAVASFPTDGQITVIFLTGEYANDFAVDVEEILDQFSEDTDEMADVDNVEMENIQRKYSICDCLCHSASR
jgi:hypothetical protein